LISLCDDITTVFVNFMTTEETTVRLWKDQPLYRCSADGYFDATRMCAACGDRRFCEYERLKRTKEYIAELEKEINPQEAARVSRGGSGSHDGGTWVHPRLAIDLARWLSPEFAVWMDGWVLENFALQHTSSDNNSTPLKAGRGACFFNQKQIINETDLHYSVIKWVRRFYPRAIIAPGLGELQDTELKRLDAWSKGYTSGQPDILFLNRHQHFSGFALELKHPGHAEVRMSDNQKMALEQLKAENWRTLTSNDYDQICFELAAYFGEFSPFPTSDVWKFTRATNTKDQNDNAFVILTKTHLFFESEPLEIDKGYEKLTFLTLIHQGGETHLKRPKLGNNRRKLTLIDRGEEEIQGEETHFDKRKTHFDRPR
jgi:hypothetical protein